MIRLTILKILQIVMKAMPGDPPLGAPSALALFFYNNFRFLRIKICVVIDSVVLAVVYSIDFRVFKRCDFFLHVLIPLSFSYRSGRGNIIFVL